MASTEWRAFQQFRQDQAQERTRSRPRLLLAILRFAASDPRAFTVRDWAAAATLVQQLHARAWLDEARVVPPDHLVPTPAVTRVRIRAVHRELRRGLSALFPADDPRFWERRRWQPPVRAQRPAVLRQHRRVSQVLEATWPDTVWITVMSLLDSLGSAIRRCPVCAEHRLFVKSKRQEYCSPQCSQRARSARWYRRHRALAQERRRAAYERRALQGRKGTIAGRPRKT
jgi:hypothetical protein